MSRWPAVVTCGVLMSKDCSNCTCSSAAVTASSGRLVLATQVGHTATALRSIALRKGMALQPLAPGLLSVRAGDLDAFIADARRELSTVEADEVRALVVDGGDLPDAALLGQAMTAPSLSVAGSRVVHADLLPLFDDEDASFHSVYQPIVDLADHRRVGYEALLRATRPDGAPVFPDVLFPAAHAAGWTHLLDRVGRTTALRDAGPWLGEDELLFINFVPTSIYRPEVCLRTTEAAARKAGVRLDQVVFEVTEGHEVRDLDHLEHVFDYYRSRNCKVALDDLGAGYSSLNMLVRLRPDIVKIDKDIVQSLPDRISAAVVSAIVDITHAYGGLVLAECVETPEQARAARDLGVDLAQGWLLGRPERPAPAGADHSALPSRSAAEPRPGRDARRVDPGLPDSAVAITAGGSDREEEAQSDEAPVVAIDAAGGTNPVLVPLPVTVPAAVVQPWVALAPAAMSELMVRAVGASASGVTVVDVMTPDAPMIYVNPAFEAMTGYTAAEVIHRNCRMLQGPDTDPATVRALSQAIRMGQEHRVVLRNYRKDGSAWWNELHLSPVRDAQWRLTHYLGFQNDVTARVEAEQQLVRQAAQDDLTGLLKRAALVEQLDAALVRASAAGQAVAVLFVDLDGFKDVNDTFGHPAGDAVLIQVAERLRGVLRGTDLLARVGGDEFVAVLVGLDPLDAPRIADRAAQELMAGVRRPFVVPGDQARLSTSVGTALHPDDASTSEALLARADAAMYRAKRAGTGRPSPAPVTTG